MRSEIGVLGEGRVRRVGSDAKARRGREVRKGKEGNGGSDADAFHEWFEAIGGRALVGGWADSLEKPFVHEETGEA